MVRLSSVWNYWSCQYKSTSVVLPGITAAVSITVRLSSAWNYPKLSTDLCVPDSLTSVTVRWLSRSASAGQLPLILHNSLFDDAGYKLARPLFVTEVEAEWQSASSHLDGTEWVTKVRNNAINDRNIYLCSSQTSGLYINMFVVHIIVCVTGCRTSSGRIACWETIWKGCDSELWGTIRDFLPQ
jgi:hypothetical protein